MPLHVLYLVTEDWYFRSHRLDLARRARDAGHTVSVGTRTGTCEHELHDAGLAVHDVPFERSLRAPLRDLRSVAAIRRLVREQAPDVVHLVSLKPILLGGLALGGKGAPPLLCAFTGLGYVFSSRAPLARMLRPVIVRALRSLARRPHVWFVVQNEDDARSVERMAAPPPGRLRLVAGSGVDLAHFDAQPLPDTPLVLLPARLLVDKGVNEFVAAARMVRESSPEVRFVIAGAHDRDNPGTLSADAVRSLEHEASVEWWGHRADMRAVYAQASIVCLPSYREGLPKVLLEGGACGRALVATDVPGCRDVCVDGETGRLVPPRDAAALARALEDLIGDPDACRRLGAAARRHVEAHFGIERVAADTLALYEAMHADARA